jgi:hypothetical protein
MRLQNFAPRHLALQLITCHQERVYRSGGALCSITKPSKHVISGFRRDVDEICALLGYYAASSGNPLPTFRDNVSAPSLRAKKSK